MNTNRKVVEVSQAQPASGWLGPNFLHSGNPVLPNLMLPIKSVFAPWEIKPQIWYAIGATVVLFLIYAKAK